MIFNSYTFCIFLSLVLGLYYWLPSWLSRKYLLLISSYVFYAAWNPAFVSLLWLSTLGDWYCSKGIDTSSQIFQRRLWLASSLILNLGLLIIFKYGNFLLENFSRMLQIFDISYTPPTADLILPIGISFYTFQTLSYTLDIYAGRAKPWPSFLDYALYVTFFPQLVAGPIVRSSEFLEQCQQPKPFTGANLGWGMSLLTVGLFEKVVVADALLAPIAETLYSSPGIPTMSSAWVGTLAFAGQIFCDFAGYSTCAIGTALCLGFKLPRNFHVPYAAIGLSDFWRRWHISLSTWLKDYVYIPLGGNRQGRGRTLTNLMITMLLGGLWHGAAWTFVLWGGLHGLYLVSERVLRQAIGHFRIWHHGLMQWLLAQVTFLLICISWVLFRSESWTQAAMIWQAMLGISTATPTLVLGPRAMIGAVGVMVVMLGVHWLLRNRTFEEFVVSLPRWSVSLGLAAMIYAIATIHGDHRAFIYFQF